MLQLFTLLTAMAWYEVDISAMPAFLKKTRFWLAGPVALLLSIFVMASLSLVLPAGDGGVNNLIIPIMLFPLLWASAFFYPLLDANKKRAAVVMLSLLFVIGGVVVAAVMGLFQ